MYQNVYVLRVPGESYGYEFIQFYPVIGATDRTDALKRGVEAIKKGIKPELEESDVDAVLTLDEWLQAAGVWL